MASRRSHLRAGCRALRPLLPLLIGITAGVPACDVAHDDPRLTPTPGNDDASTPTPTPEPSPTPLELPSTSLPIGATDWDNDGFIARADCDDGDVTAYPGAPEACDGVDDDCDGIVDDSDGPRFEDGDGDGFGRGDPVPCSPGGLRMALDRGDCDDNLAFVHPGAADAASDGVYQDCGGTAGPEPHVGLGASSSSMIQAAMDRAEPGTTVWVGAGRYLEHDLDFRGKSITLRSTRLADGTVVDAQQQGRGFSFMAGEGASTVLDGFTITGGHARTGGGALIKRSSPTLTACVFVENIAEGVDGAAGGALRIEDAAPTLLDCTIRDNTSRDAGERGDGSNTSPDASASGDGSNTSPDASAGGDGSNTSLDASAGGDGSNTSPDASAGGDGTTTAGGLSIVRSTVLMSGCDVTSNGAGLGGGIAVQDSALTLWRTTVYGNHASDVPSGAGSGGGILAASSLLQIDESVVSRNGAGVWGGGGLAVDHSILLMNDSVVEGNGSDSGASGIALVDSSAMLTRTLITQNTSGGPDGAGGAIYGTASDLTLDRCLAYRNSGVGHGALLFQGALRLRHSVLLENRCSIFLMGQGSCVAGIHFSGAGPLEIDHSILADNQGDEGVTGYNLYVSDAAPLPTITSSDLYNPLEELNHNLPGLDQSNQTVDPAFVPWDLHLALESPLIDAGDVMQPDPDGSPADIGLFGGTEADTWDLDCDGLPTWFWPGSHSDAPGGIDATLYDSDTVPRSGSGYIPCPGAFPLE